jgi:hypothetical protein
MTPSENQATVVDILIKVAELKTGLDAHLKEHDRLLRVWGVLTPLISAVIAAVIASLLAKGG